MGSHSFYETVWDEPTPKMAYEVISDHFRSLHSGVVQTHPFKVSQREAERLARASFRDSDTLAKFDIDGYGNAGAIAIHGEDEVGGSAREVRITVPAGSTYADSVAKVKLAEGERIVNSEMMGRDKFYQSFAPDTRLFMPKQGVKAAVESTKGTSRTVYRLYEVRSHGQSFLLDAGEADTLAEARVKFSEYIEARLDGITNGESRYAVRGVQVKGDSQDLLTITPRARRGTVEMVFSVAKFVPNERTGWVIWGWAKD